MSKKIAFEEFAEYNLSEETLEKVSDELYNSQATKSVSEWEQYCNKHFDTTF